MARARRKRPRRSRVSRLLRRALLTITLLVLISGVAAGALVYSELTATLPSVHTLDDVHLPTATQVLADDGTLIGEFYVQKRYVVPIERIPVVVRNAFVAAEDESFYRHPGVDVVSIFRAFVNNMSGDQLQGGSTITQQVVKSLLLTPERSYERKIKEMVLALRLERHFSKDEILSLYLNHIYLGSGAYGVAAAAQEYFGKSVEDLNLAEAALLGGLPQAPSRYSPLKHWRRAKARQQYVLRRMLEAQMITMAEHDAALATPIALAPRKGSYVAAPYYVEHVRRLLEERYGPDALYQLGLRVYTAANVAMNEAGQEALRHGLEVLDARQGGDRRPITHLRGRQLDAFLAKQAKALGDLPLRSGSGVEAVVVAGRRGEVAVRIGSGHGSLLADDGHSLPSFQPGDVVRAEVRRLNADGSYQLHLDPEPRVQGALLAMEPGTGWVKAMIGGYDFNRSRFNRAVQAERQPGSAFKPFIYAAALDRRYTPASIIVDEPVTFPDNRGWWTPHNYEDRYYGPTTLRDALTYSRNVVTVKLLNNIGLPYLIKYLRQIGFQSPLAPNLSLALGSSEVNLLELASAYGVLANGGVRNEPVFITRIVDSQGTIIFDATPQRRQVIPATTAYQVTDMLRSVIERGTGTRAKDLRRPAAGKTGTTNDLNDAWFMGYTPQLLAGVWVGFDEKESLGPRETGGRVAAPIWTDFMKAALDGKPIEDFAVPQGIVLTQINPKSGERALPGDNGAVLEAFRRGTEPAEVSSSYTPPTTTDEIAAREFLRNED